MAAGLLVLGLAGGAGATLTTIGTASYNGSSYNLIYDADSPFGPITWLDYTKSPSTWQNQMNWAAGLSGAGVLTYAIDPGLTVGWTGDWRLPATVEGYNTWGYDGTTAAGYNITSSELGHLYYTELRNKGYYATDGTHPQLGWGLHNQGPFTNLDANWYWSGTEDANDPSYAWDF